MSKKPILILQLQRMGDLVLTFPLIGWLKSQYPDTPVWVVGEKVFYEGLLKISPPVTYFSYADSHALHSQEYSLIINLSHRPEAAKLAAALKAESKIGPYINDKGNMYISGNWQLYRASVSHNNRHNLFHWSDLNAMDLIPAPTMARTYWPPIQKKEQTQSGKVGLFVGASEANKRPDTDFWVYLAAKFIRMGVKPVLLGGKGDMALAAQIAAKLGAPAINLSGNFSITELCTFIGQLNLFIAPDTGPMHIANWLGVPTLNLSLGPVNAWETAPTSPGQYVLRSSLSCVGCWECTQKSVRCKEGMQAEKVAVIARMLLEGKHEMLAKAEFAGNQLWRTTRDKYGLYNLEPVNGIYPEHLERSKFWKHFFGLQLGFLPQEAEFNLYSAATAMRANGLHTSCVKGGTALLQAVNTAMRNNNFTALQNSDFWLHYPPVMRPLSSYIQFMVNNSDFSKKSLLTA
ncbi:glycosyltransferase family 9 protein, partial [Desulfovibrio sp. OttesenSCG-928-F07]|nr:glycosyltransferase family 9 protein [Desulfovibrio sp. OttesenSCG-928-F07]